jgi:hypothetical protein
MNIALGALVLFLLLFPGIVLRIAYLNGPYSVKNIQSSLVDELVLSLIPAFILQASGYLLAEYCFGFNIDVQTVYQLIVGATVDKYRPDFALIESSIGYTLFYNLCLLLMALFLGKGSRYFVEKWNLDIYVPSLRFYNDWYYLFSGRILDEPGAIGSSSDIEWAIVSVVVETKEGAYIIRGVLEDYFLSKDGLDRIYLSTVYRRKLGVDLEAKKKTENLDEDDRYYSMPGEFFVIPYKEIKNINVDYFRLQKVGKEA